MHRLWIDSKTTTLMVALVMTVTGIGAEISKKQISDLDTDHKAIKIASRGLPGSHTLMERARGLMEKYQNPAELNRTRMNKKTAWNFQVGDTKEWYAYSWVTTNDYLVSSTCRAVGEKCYVFVEDAMWNTPGDFMIVQSHVDSLVAYFDSKTPGDKNKGIYSTVTEHFGSPPNTDSDGKIIILILDIKDGYDPDGESGYIAGYFDPTNQFPKSQYDTSNEAEMFYMDANPIDYDSFHMMYSALATLSHEFQHMVHFNYDWREDTFVNEGCSEVAMVVCGFPIRSPGRYFSDTDKYLFGWNDDDGTHLDDYSRAALWTTYLYDQLPAGFLKNLVQDTTTGDYGVENAIKTSLPSTTRLVPEMFYDWTVANLINDTSVDPRYGYLTDGISGQPSVVYEFYTPNIGPEEEVVNSFGVDYIRYVGLKDLSITFGGSQWVDIVAVKRGATTEVEPVVTGTTYSIPDFDSNYDDVVFVVRNTKNLPQTYSFTSTGTTSEAFFELAFDGNEPYGYYPWDQGDSVAVWFDGIEGSTIDSIRVAFRHEGTAVFGIWEFNGSGASDLRGNVLKDSIVFNVTTAAEVVNSGGYPPYAVPYPNWYTADLTEFNIPGDADFIVTYEVDVDENEPHVVVSKDPISGSVHSYIFTTSTLGNMLWFPMDFVADDSVGNFLIRAYLSIADPNAALDPVKSILPGGYELSQNYPNPFNPGTVIEFYVPTISEVKVDVYDLRGSLVNSLTNKNYNSGRHKLYWNGTTTAGNSAASGVYLAVMQVNGHRLTRKMILLR